MKPPWLLLDMSNLAHRALHSTGVLQYEDIQTGVLYGIFREILQLQQQFQTSKVCFCFDYGQPHRKNLLPTYKSTRKDNLTPEKKEGYRKVKEQLTAMRNGYLSDVGFQNIFWQKGYEADDLIAEIVLTHPKKNFIIVSSDQDLYQLLSQRCSIYNAITKRLKTEATFIDEYGISPSQWVDVKAIAGCKSDDVPKIKGIGEKTAIKFLTGKLDPKSKAFKTIVKRNKRWKKNLPLVELPFAGIKPIKLTKDEVSIKEWRKLLKSLGMKSLLATLSLVEQTNYTRAEFLRG